MFDWIIVRGREICLAGWRTGRDLSVRAEVCGVAFAGGGIFAGDRDLRGGVEFLENIIFEICANFFGDLFRWWWGWRLWWSLRGIIMFIVHCL